MFPFTSTLSCQTALFTHGVKLATVKCVGKCNWNKCIARNEYDKIKKKIAVINKSVACYC
jgi:hypothetical protein